MINAQFLCQLVNVAILVYFWETVCKMVRPMLSDRCPVWPVLSVTVYCGQTVGRIKMKLGMQVDLGPGHIVLGGDSSPLAKGA